MSTSTVASLTCWVKDVVRTKRLSPPNPILESLPSSTDEGLPPTPLEPDISNLPKFSILQPHHLEKAAEEISRQHDVELAQLEVRWTSVDEDEETDVDEASDGDATARPSSSTTPPSLCSLLVDLDRLTAPLAQLQEVSDLYQTLASPPDKVDHWIEASEGVDSAKTKEFLEKLYRSRIIYRALASAIAEAGANTATKPPSFLVPFLKRGAHLDTHEGDAEREAQSESLQQFQEELTILNDRLDNVVSYDRASKAMRLQCMSDMYNCIGLSRLQAESLLSSNGANHSVWDLARLQHHHMVTSPQTQLLDSLFPELASFLQAHLPKQAKLDLEGVGAFLEGKSEVGNTINSGGIADAQKEVLKAKYYFKESIRLHGVLEGLMDFCDQILGIVVVEDTEANNAEAGWSINVRLLHLYEKAAAATSDGEEDPKGAYLGTIYFDPFADSYWRTEEAKNLVTTHLFGHQVTGQTTAPIAVVALKITPIWDDTPVPMTWKDTRDLLYQFGKAIQLVLDQSRRRRNYATNNPPAIEPSPIDCSEFLAHFLELWLQNDGFLHRLAQLSQDELVLDEETTIKSLRGDLRSEKALELANTMFLSALQYTVFEEFDPRGDETLVSLQERLATKYLPGSNLPEPSDLSPLLAVFQESGLDQTMSAYGTLWSEVLACTVYETFQKTDLRDREEVERLGTGIRDLFLRGGKQNKNGTNDPLTQTDFALMCRTEEELIGSGAPLARVYGFIDSDPTGSADQGKNNDENE